MPNGGVAELTARGARTAGGRLSRRDVLAQLAPSCGADPTPRAERISLLLATDVLSEGLDLHGASVVVHLDLPWNPARLEQRVGRVRRMGSPHSTVFAYALAPPASAEHLLRVEARLRAKLGVAHDLIAVGSRVIPAPENARTSPGRAEISSEALQRLERWRGHGACSAPSSRPASAAAQIPCAAVTAHRAGFLALIADEDSPILVARFDGAVTLEVRVINECVRALDGVPAPVDASALAQ